MRVALVCLGLALTPALTSCVGPSAGQCTDQTSRDGNWDNDMLCKRPNGKTFETDYAGAEKFERKHAK